MAENEVPPEEGGGSHENHGAASQEPDQPIGEARAHRSRQIRDIFLKGPYPNWIRRRVSGQCEGCQGSDPDQDKPNRLRDELRPCDGLLATRSLGDLLALDRDLRHEDRHPNRHFRGGVPLTSLPDPPGTGNSCQNTAPPKDAPCWTVAGLSIRDHP